MHSVFRIGQVEQIEKNHRLWQVKLTLTSDNDPQLKALAKNMQEATAKSTGWVRLGRRLMKIAQFDKTQQVFDIILGQTSDESEKGEIYGYLVLIKTDQEKYTQALSYYDKVLEIYQKTLPANHPNLATSYDNIGGVYDDMGEYSKAFSYYERALDIEERSLPPNHPRIKIVKQSIEIVKEKRSHR